MPSLLEVVAAADNFPSHHHDSPYPTHHPNNPKIKYTPFHLTFSDYQRHLIPVGLLRQDVLEELLVDERDPGECPWQFHHSARPVSGPLDDDGDGDGDLELVVSCVFFADWVVEQGFEGMNRVIQAQAEKWRDEGKFPGPLGGWRNEQYMIYCSPHSSALKNYDSTKPFSNAAFALERSACAVFGFATFGVHMTAYEGEGKDMKIWVPRRSATKATWPSRLDNSVAGGIPAGMTPLESMIKECDEEASLSDDFVRPRLKSTGVVTYFYITDDGFLQPEVEYIYDLPLPPQSSPEYIKPKPHDDEVESFALLSVSEVLEAMYRGEFKPNCGLILVDFLIRHGIVTVENEKDYMEIRWRTARRLGVAVAA